jgi:hypothetical protein
MEACLRELVLRQGPCSARSLDQVGGYWLRDSLQVLSAMCDRSAQQHCLAHVRLCCGFFDHEYLDNVVYQAQDGGCWQSYCTTVTPCLGWSCFAGGPGPWHLCHPVGAAALLWRLHRGRSGGEEPGADIRL